TPIIPATVRRGALAGDSFAEEHRSEHTDANRALFVVGHSSAWGGVAVSRIKRGGPGDAAADGQNDRRRMQPLRAPSRLHAGSDAWPRPGRCVLSGAWISGSARTGGAGRAYAARKSC